MKSAAGSRRSSLGGWANPHADAAAQVGHLLDETSPPSST